MSKKLRLRETKLSQKRTNQGTKRRKGRKVKSKTIESHMVKIYYEGNKEKDFTENTDETN